MEKLVEEILEQRKLLFMILFICGIICSDAYGQEENWFTKLNKIKLTSSTKEEVEKLFDFPAVHYEKKFPGYEAVTYDTKDGLLRIWYLLGECSSKNGDVVVLNNGVVFDIFFSAENSLKVKKLKINLADFSVERSVDTPHWIYSNGEQTISYGLFNNKELVSVRYSLEKDFDQKYECK